MRPRVISALFFETSTNEDQYSYSFETHCDGDSNNRLLNYTNNGHNLSSSTLSRAIGDVIKYQSKVNDRIEIPGGFDGKRLSFIITLVTSDAGGYGQRQILTGYTDHDGVSKISKKLDERMELYINNSIVIRDTPFQSSRGRTHRSIIESNEYIIRGRSGNRRGLFDENQGDRLIRPYDIFNDHGVADIQRMSPGERIVDTRADMSGDIKMGIRSDNNAGEYLSRILRAGVTAETTEARAWHPESAGGGQTESRAEVSAGMVNVSNIDENPTFLEFLSRCDFTKEGKIQLGMMAEAVDWPETISGKPVTSFISAAERSRSGYRTFNRGDGASLRGAGHESVAVRIISQTIPAILMSHQMSGATISITNDTLDGQVNVLVSDWQPLIFGDDVSRNITAVEELVRIQVANPITRNNQVLVDATVNLSVVTDIVIDISMENEESERYIIPMYCDGLLSPQRTSDHDMASKISNDLRTTIGDITDSLYQDRGPSDSEGIQWDDGYQENNGRDNPFSRSTGRNKFF